MPPKARILRGRLPCGSTGSPSAPSAPFLRALGDEVLDHILLAQPVAAADGIVEMVVQAVFGPRTRGGPAFCGHGMAAHGEHLRNQRDFQRDRLRRQRSPPANRRHRRLRWRYRPQADSAALPCLAISIKQPDCSTKKEGAIPVTSCASLYAEDYAGSVEVYHISERRLCHASRSGGPNDDFSTDQALNDLRSDKPCKGTHAE